MIKHHSRRTKCELVKTKKLGDATVTNQCHWNNDFGSTGRRSGGTIIDAGSETINVSAGTGYIKANDSDTDDLLAFDWEASSGISIPTNSTRFIGIKYNGGTPIVDSRVSQNWDLDTEFPLGSVINLNGTLYILNNPWWVTDGITNLIEKSVGIGGYLARDNFVGGLTLGVTATRYPTMTAGTVWGRTNEFEMSAIDYSTPTGSFYLYWFESDGTIHEETNTGAGYTQYPITQWNDVDNDQLDTINNNWFANWWVFLNITNNELALIYPQNQYANAAAAEAESIPSNIPGDWFLEGIIIGRILFQQGNDTPIEVQSVFETMFTAALAADHGNLTGLSDDDHEQYLLADGTRAMTGNLYVPDKIGIGTNDFFQTINGISTTSKLVSIVDTAATTVGLAIGEYGNTAAKGATMYGARTRGTEGSPTVVQDGDNIFDIIGAGFDGTDFAQLARIDMEVDGTPGNNDMPGRIKFSVSPDGGQTPAEAMRISQDKSVTMEGTLSVAGDIKNETKCWDITITSPNAFYDIDTQIPVALAKSALTVTKIQVSLNTTAQDVTGDLKWADDLTSFTNATVINDFDTSSGVRTDDSITAGQVAAGKWLYLQFDAQPNADITWMTIHIEWDYD